MSFRNLLAIALVSLGFVFPSPLHAKTTFPAKPINFIIGWAPGGGSDPISRVLCAEAGAVLNKPIVIKNMEGGSGATAYSYIAKSKPDGYTIGVNTATLVTHKLQGILSIDYKDFAIIAGVNVDPTALWVNSDSPMKTVDDFVQYVRKHPGEVTVASSNPGSTTAIALIGFAQQYGLDLRPISQQGGTSKGMVALAGGHVDAAIAEPLVGMPLAKVGKIRMLGIMHPERLKAVPDVPTFAEAGYPMIGGTFRMIIAPKDTPAEVVDILHAAFDKAARGEKFGAFIEDNASDRLLLTIEQCTAYLDEAAARYTDVLQKLGLLKTSTSN